MLGESVRYICGCFIFIKSETDAKYTQLLIKLVLPSGLYFGLLILSGYIDENLEVRGVYT